MDANGPRTGDTGGGFVPSARTGDRRPRAGSAPSRASGSSTVSAPGAAADGGPDGGPALRAHPEVLAELETTGCRHA